jgi:arsenate reductase (thioredoxin)
MAEPIFNVLFLCTGNSARSIMAEAILNNLGRGRFRTFSARSLPKGAVNPLALGALASSGAPTDGLFSKNWEAFATAGAPTMDFVFTFCEAAAGEVCPVWPGQPMTAHWGIEDPAAVEGTDIQKEAAFVTAARYLRNRIAAFMSLPTRSLEDLSLRAKLQEIGQMPGASSNHPNAK